jgi:hypothetical protein
MSPYSGWNYVGADGYYDPGVGAWPWGYGVGQVPPIQVGPAEIVREYDPTRDPNWAGARALVRSTIQSVLGVDSIFDQIVKQVVEHLRQQGFIDGSLAARITRSDMLAKQRAFFRQLLYYMDVDTLIDLGTRQLVRATHSGKLGKSPYG